MRLLTAGSFSGCRHLRQRKTAMGTPQIRWREMHQSGREDTMLAMRSCPHWGSHFTRPISSSARWRKVVTEPSAWVMGVSMPINHCSVARKMTGQ